jgi:hypothetical protein
VDTLGDLLALHGTAAQAQDRSPVSRWAEKVQEVTGASVEIAYGDQGDTGAPAAQAAAAPHIPLEVVNLPTAKKGFVLLPQRWVGERSTA